MFLKRLSQLAQKGIQTLGRNVLGEERFERAKEVSGRVISSVRSQMTKAGLFAATALPLAGCSDTGLQSAPVDPSCPYWYLDADGDGYGDTFGVAVQACGQPEPVNGVPYVDNSDDCDDSAPLLVPNGNPSCLSRAAWFWNAEEILLDEDATARYANVVSDLNIDAVYIAASPLLEDNAATVDTWNAVMHGMDARTYLLFSSRAWICDSAELAQGIEEFGRFNSSRSFQAGLFDGIALNDEPWALDGTNEDCTFDWSDEVPEVRRLMLNSFALNVVEARDWLDATLDQQFELIEEQNTPESLELSVALPWWADTFGEDGIWLDEGTRNQWYQTLALALDEGVIMAGFELDNGAVVDRANQTLQRSLGEIQSDPFPVRIAFDATDGSWTPEDAIQAGILTEQSSFGNEIVGTAFHDLRVLVESREE